MDRLNAVMILTRQQHYLDEARAWVARLDRTRNLNEQRVYVYYLQYGKAGQVAQTLQGALSGLNVEVKGGETANPEGLGAGTTAMPLPPVSPTATGFPTPHYALAALVEGERIEVRYKDDYTIELPDLDQRPVVMPDLKKEPEMPEPITIAS